jgi:hypothetical protein
MRIALQPQIPRMDLSHNSIQQNHSYRLGVCITFHMNEMHTKATVCLSFGIKGSQTLHESDSLTSKTWLRRKHGAKLGFSYTIKAIRMSEENSSSNDFESTADILSKSQKHRYVRHVSFILPDNLNAELEDDDTTSSQATVNIPQEIENTVEYYPDMPPENWQTNKDFWKRVSLHSGDEEGPQWLQLFDQCLTALNSNTLGSAASFLESEEGV